MEPQGRLARVLLPYRKKSEICLQHREQLPGTSMCGFPGFIMHLIFTSAASILMVYAQRVSSHVMLVQLGDGGGGGDRLEEDRLGRLIR